MPNCAALTALPPTHPSPPNYGRTQPPTRLAPIQSRRAGLFPLSNPPLDFAYVVAQCIPMRTDRRKKSLIRARCSNMLRTELERAAQAQELDISDILRLACWSYIKALKCQSPTPSESGATHS